MNEWKSCKGTVIERSITKFINYDTEVVSQMSNEDIRSACLEASDNIAYLYEENKNLKEQIEKLQQSNEDAIDEAWEKGYRARTYA